VPPIQHSNGQMGTRRLSRKLLILREYHDEGDGNEGGQVEQEDEGSAQSERRRWKEGRGRGQTGRCMPTTRVRSSSFLEPERSNDLDNAPPSSIPQIRKLKP